MDAIRIGNPFPPFRFGAGIHYISTPFPFCCAKRNPDASRLVGPELKELLKSIPHVASESTRPGTVAKNIGAVISSLTSGRAISIPGVRKCIIKPPVAKSFRQTITEDELRASYSSGE